MGELDLTVRKSKASRIRIGIAIIDYKNSCL